MQAHNASIRHRPLLTVTRAAYHAGAPPPQLASRLPAPPESQDFRKHRAVVPAGGIEYWLFFAHFHLRLCALNLTSVGSFSPSMTHLRTYLIPINNIYLHTPSMAHLHTFTQFYSFGPLSAISFLFTHFRLYASYVSYDPWYGVYGAGSCARTCNIF